MALQETNINNNLDWLQSTSGWSQEIHISKFTIGGEFTEDRLEANNKLQNRIAERRLGKSRNKKASFSRFINQVLNTKATIN